MAKRIADANNEARADAADGKSYADWRNRRSEWRPPVRPSEGVLTLSRKDAIAELWRRNRQSSHLLRPVPARHAGPGQDAEGEEVFLAVLATHRENDDGHCHG